MASPGLHRPVALLNRGDLVTVGNEVGVVTHLGGEDDVPEDHLAIWYGQVEEGKPKVRTVPAEYCEKVQQVLFYH